jgi:sulfatase modifying factor 1
MKAAVLLTLCALAAGRNLSADETEWIRVEAGEFQRGEKDLKAINKGHPYSVMLSESVPWGEAPQHWVQLTKGFEIAATEVTVGQFRAFVEATEFVTDAEKNGNATGFDPKREYSPKWLLIDPKFTWKSPGFEQGDDHPVVCVSWKDAQAYCAWLSRKEGRTLRLPTEAEWEYAARAGTGTWYSWGDKPDDAYVHANVADASLERAYPKTTYYQRSIGLDSDAHSDDHIFTAPVGSLQANPWGLHDIHGNVWEWCQDIWELDTYTNLLSDVETEQRETHRIVDPTGPATTEKQELGDWRVLRGGCWYTGPISSRSAMRAFAEASDGMCYAGFRLVRSR